MTDTPARPARPLSPHLQIYRQGFTGTLSILHRISGIVLSAALPVLVIWLIGLSQGAEAYGTITGYLLSPLGKLCLMGWAAALSYHLCAGIRHLVWDAGWGFELKQVYLSGKIMLGATATLTLILWIAILKG